MSNPDLDPQAILYGEWSRSEGTRPSPWPPLKPDRFCSDDLIIQHLNAGTSVQSLDELKSLYRRLARDAARLQRDGWELESVDGDAGPTYRLRFPSTRSKSN